jgi:hypothetical protein
MIDESWARVMDSLPPYWFLSSLVWDSLTSRWIATARYEPSFGVSIWPAPCGVGETPHEALDNLTIRLKEYKTNLKSMRRKNK